MGVCMNILVTGGAGYIGSHTVRALIHAGFTPIVVDNFSRGHRNAIPSDVKVIELDIANPKIINVLRDNNIKRYYAFCCTFSSWRIYDKSIDLL